MPVLFRPQSALIKPPLGSVIDYGHPLANGLIGCWPLNEGRGSTVYDIARRRNPGTLVNMEANDWVASAQGWALNLDGVAEYVAITQQSQLPLYDNLVGGYSVAIWVKLDTVTKRYVLVGEGLSTTNTPFLMIETDYTIGDKINVSIRNDAGAVTLDKNSATLLTTNWTHIVWTDKNGAGALYINGVADATSFSYTPAGTLTLNRTAIGVLKRLTADYFLAGQVAGVWMWNRQLSAAEAAQHYRQPWAMVRAPAPRKWWLYTGAILRYMTRTANEDLWL